MSKTETENQWNNRTILFIVIAIIAGSLGAFLILNLVMTAQDNMDNAGLKFSKMDRGLAFSQ